MHQSYWPLITWEENHERTWSALSSVQVYRLRLYAERWCGCLHPSNKPMVTRAHAQRKNCTNIAWQHVVYTVVVSHGRNKRTTMVLKPKSFVYHLAYCKLQKRHVTSPSINYALKHKSCFSCLASTTEYNQQKEVALNYFCDSRSQRLKRHWTLLSVWEELWEEPAWAHAVGVSGGYFQLCDGY